MKIIIIIKWKQFHIFGVGCCSPDLFQPCSLCTKFCSIVSFPFFMQNNFVMISVQSHSKQIKLLNDYIAALERQLSGARKELEDVQKGGGQNGDELRRLNEELNRFRNINEQLKFQVYKQEDQLRNMTALQREFLSMREQLNRQNQQKINLQGNLGMLVERAQKAEKQLRGLDEMGMRRVQSWQQDRGRMRAQLQQLKKIIVQKEKKSQELTQLLGQQKLNGAIRLSNLESSSNDVLRHKSQTIQKMGKQNQEFKKKIAEEMAFGVQCRNSFEGQINKLNAELQSSRQEGNRMKFQLKQCTKGLQKRKQQLSSLTLLFNSKNQEYLTFIKKSNQDKNILANRISILQEEKKQLMAVNLQSKGDITQQTKALSETIISNQQLTKNIKITREQLVERDDKMRELDMKLNETVKYADQLKAILEIRDMKIQDLSRQLDNAQIIRNNIAKEREEIDRKYGELIKQKYSDNAQFTNEVESRERKIRELSANVEELQINLASEVRKYSKIIKDIEGERDYKVANLNQVGQELHQFGQQIQKMQKENQLLLATLQLRDLKIGDLQQEGSNAKKIRISLQKNKQELQCKYNQLFKQKYQQKQQFMKIIQRLEQQLKEANSKTEQLSVNLFSESQRSTKAIKELQQERNEKTKTMGLTGQQINMLSQKIQQMEKQNHILKTNLQLRQIKINDFSREIENARIVRVNVERTKEELQKKYTDLFHQKFADKDYFAKEIDVREQRIRELSGKHQELSIQIANQNRRFTNIIKVLESQRDGKVSNLGQAGQEIANLNQRIMMMAQRIEELERECSGLRDNVGHLNQQFGGYKKKKESQLEEVSAKLRESQKRVQKNKGKIEELNCQIKQLESNFQNSLKNVDVSQREELERMKGKLAKTANELKQQKQQAVGLLQSQIEKLLLHLETERKQGEQKIRSLKDEQMQKQRKNKEAVKALQAEVKALQDQVKQYGLSSFIQTQFKTGKQLQIQVLKRNNAQLQLTIKQQKKQFQQLMILISAKNKQLQTIQGSNTTLRRQLISAINNEQSSRKQLIQTRSRGSSVIHSSSRITLNGLSDASCRKKISNKTSGVTAKRRTMYSNQKDLQLRNQRGMSNQNLLSGVVYKKNLSNQWNMKNSYVDELNDLGGGGQMENDISSSDVYKAETDQK